MKNNGESVSKTDLIHLFVSLPTNDVCSLRDISTDVLIHQVKSRIELRVGIPGDLIHLFFMNIELADGKTLREYKLKHGCILRVRLHKTWLGLFIACSKGDTYDVFQNGVQAMSESSEDFDVELWNKLVVKRATFALLMATYHGYLSLMLELLNSSAADINGCTLFGRTCLHIAAFQGFVGCISLLLSEGAESSVLDVFGKTPLQLAYVNRHTYCQKRLYMHQTSTNQDSLGKAGEKSRHRPKTAPHQILKNLKQNQRTKKNVSTKAVLAERTAESLPSITITTKDPSMSPHSHTNPSPFYELPVMEIIEPVKTHHPEGEISSPQYSTPIVRPRTAPEPSRKCSTPRGIRGIEEILRTSQHDVVGEYHNIDESIADINVTTLKLSLPRKENMTATDDERKLNQGDTRGHYDVLEARTQSSASKKMLGFVLKAEESRNVKHEKQTNGYPESDNQDYKLWAPTINGSPESHKQCERLWTPPTNDNGYPDLNHQDTSLLTRGTNTIGSPELDQQDDRLWTPAGYYDNVPDNSRKASPHHRRFGPSLSYDEWLEKKRETSKESRDDRPASASSNLRSKVGRELDMAAFQKWLEGKKKFRKRSKPETAIEHHRVSSGVTFESWLQQKRELGENDKPECLEQTPGNADQRPKAVNLGGKSFSEWLAEKTKVYQFDETAGKQKRNRSHSGKTFREWLKDKNKEKQDESDLKESLAISELQQKALTEEQRKLNPRVKTFEEWFEEKRSQSVIELIQSKNVPGESELLNSKTRYPEDACLVFNMWLTSKNAEDLGKEERLYEEMVEKWRRKEQERLLVRRSILSRLSQTRKDK